VLEDVASLDGSVAEHPPAESELMPTVFRNLLKLLVRNEPSVIFNKRIYTETPILLTGYPKAVL